MIFNATTESEVPGDRVKKEGKQMTMRKGSRNENNKSIAKGGKERETGNTLERINMNTPVP